MDVMNQNPNVENVKNNLDYNNLLKNLSKLLDTNSIDEAKQLLRMNIQNTQPDINSNNESGMTSNDIMRNKLSQILSNRQ